MAYMTRIARDTAVGTLTYRVQAPDTSWDRLDYVTRRVTWAGMPQWQVSTSVQQPLAAGICEFTDYECPLGAQVYYGGYVSRPVGAARETLYISSLLTTNLIDDPEVTFLASTDTPWNMSIPHVESLSELTRQTPLSVFQVIEAQYPLVVTNRTTGRTGVLVLQSKTFDEMQAMWSLLNLGSVLLLRTSENYGIGLMYFVVAETNEARVTPLGAIPYRRFTLSFTECSPPVEREVVLPWNQWARVKAGTATWTTLLAERGTWQNVLTTPYPAV
jgi:hypothetical protein